MSIFVIFRALSPAQLEAALVREFPDDHRKLENNEYLVSAAGSAKEVSDKLGISDGNTGPAIVFRMSSYFGRAPGEIWEWIKLKAEQAGG